MVNIDVVFSDDEALLAQRLRAYPSVFVIADRKIRKFIAEPLVELLAEKGVALRGLNFIRTGEKRKNLDTVGKILSWLLRAGADRDSLVLAVGGGITTDLVGFAACIYKRGVRYANVPTTLLAQVDASIGGKTGCNVDGYKNMAGLIRQPEFTFINPVYIRTLPWKEFCCGYAEMLKTFIIGDPTAYEDAVRLENFDKIGPLVEAAVNIKKKLVQEDELDRGERRKLNLGHTYAHAIECRSKGRIPHGMAVAIGIVMAARRSEKQKMAKRGLADRIVRDFENVGLPTSSRWDEVDLAECIKADKKSADGKVHFVLIKEIGDTVIE